MILPLVVTLAAVVAVPAAPPETAPLADCRAGTDLGRLPAVMREAARDLTGEAQEAVLDGAAHMEDLAQMVRLLCDDLDRADFQVGRYEHALGQDDIIIESRGRWIADWLRLEEKEATARRKAARREKWAALARLLEGFAFGYGARALTD